MGIPSYTLVFDNSNADGCVNKWGHGYTWEFLSERQDAGTSAESFSPKWLLSNCEIIPGLNAVSLLGYSPPQNHVLSGWTAEEGSGYWRIDYPDAWPRASWLSYIDSRAGHLGRILSSADYAPRLCIHLIEFSPPGDQTLELAYTAIDLIGDGTASSGYRIALPLHSQGQAGKYPQLGHGQPDSFEIVDEFQRADGMSGQAGGIQRRRVWIEYRAGLLIVRCDGWSEPWIYEPESGHDPVAGPVAVQFYGHAGLCNVAPIYYPEDGYATPAQYRTIPDRYVSGSAGLTDQFGVALEGEFVTNWVITSQWPDGDAGSRYRPRLEMSRIDATSSPLVMAIHDQFDTEFSIGDSSPVSTQERAATAADPAECIALSWKRNLHRDWSFRATFRDPNNYWVDYLKPGMKCTISAGIGGAEHQLMVGYIGRPTVARQAGAERGDVPYVEIEGRDYILARLAGKKFMRAQPSPVGWDLAHWAEAVLGNANCTAERVFATTGVIVEQSGRKALQHTFRADDDLVLSLDKIFALYNWVPLSINAEGEVWSGPEVTYGGTPDFVLNEATATGDDRIERIEVSFQDDNFRNAVGVVGALDALAEIVDLDSVQNAESENFIGDDAWGMERADDNADPDTRAASLLDLWLNRRRMLKWTREAATSLAPGMFVEVTVGNLGVPAGTLFRIVGDEGNIDMNYSRGTSTFYCEDVTVA